MDAYDIGNKISKYWAALLWHQLMGTKVYDAGVKIEEGVHLYAHSTAGKNKGVTLLILNTISRSKKCRKNS